VTVITTNPELNGIESARTAYTSLDKMVSFPSSLPPFLYFHAGQQHLPVSVAAALLSTPYPVTFVNKNSK